MCKECNGCPAAAPEGTTQTIHLTDTQVDHLLSGILLFHRMCYEKALLVKAKGGVGLESWKAKAKDVARTQSVVLSQIKAK